MGNTLLPSAHVIGLNGGEIRKNQDSGLAGRDSQTARYQQLAAIINSSDDAIIGRDVDGIVTSWNVGAEKIFGYSEGEMVGCSILRLVPADRWAEEQAILARLSRGERVEHFETVRLSKEGVPIQVSVSVSRVRDQEGNMIGTSKIARDITRRKTAEEALHASEARYERMAANVPGMVYQLRLEPDGRFTYPFVSRGCQEIYGLEPAALEADALLGMNMIHADDRAGFDASLLASAKSLRAWNWQGRIVRPDNGEIRSTHAAARPDRQADGAVVWDGVVMDITERERADEDRRAKEIAERANLAKSEFISRMSHELRTPLNAILGFGQLLELDSLGRRQQESVRHIIGGGRQLLELINEVLDIALVESGHMAMSLEDVAVREVALETLTLIGPLAAARGIHCELLPGTPGQLLVTADKQRLRQVLLNLLSNAVKYNASGGRITVDLAVEAGRVRLRVADTGPGISAEMRARLFIAFDRLGAELQGIQGTGLGLALSRHLMEAMGGNLGVEEPPASLARENHAAPGAVFWLELPVAPGASVAAARLPEAPADSGAEVTLPRGRTILYIEDNVSNLRLVERLMERYPDVRLITATTGASGLDLALDYRPDLILLDLHLGDMPGRDVLARLRGEPSTRGIPVVIISADVADAQLTQMLEAGACACLTKPLDLKKFLSVVRDAFKDPRDSET
jgi:PAS domain S-box-containing protein